MNRSCPKYSHLGLKSNYRFIGNTEDKHVKLHLRDIIRKSKPQKQVKDKQISFCDRRFARRKKKSEKMEGPII